MLGKRTFQCSTPVFKSISEKLITPMPFPDYPRFIYEKNPLERVICQLRFPTILKINTQPPADFQDKIRTHYPILEERIQAGVQFPNDVPDEIKQLLLPVAAAGSSGKRAYDFTSEDGVWTVSLTSDFVALTTTNYTRWEEFRNHLQIPFDALVDVYAPAFFSRVGLRYIDVIKPSLLDIEDIENKRCWDELLKPHIAGELNDDAISSAVKEKFSNTIIALSDDNGIVRLQHGISTDPSDEEMYTIDSDFFTEKKVDIDDTFNVLDKFNQNGRRLFRWCITDKLHQAMVPKPIGTTDQ